MMVNGTNKVDETVVEFTLQKMDHYMKASLRMIELTGWAERSTFLVKFMKVSGRTQLDMVRVSLLSKTVLTTREIGKNA